SANAYDYQQKYAEDAYDEEMGPSARFWHVLLDEARIFDMEMVEGWRDTLDVLLVFAGLFSAVVTTLVVQSSQALQPNYGQISVALMIEMVALQRAWASGLPDGDVPRSKLPLDAAAATPLDYWCNGLWFASLTLSLSAALMAVLVKQWLQAYTLNVSGTPREQALTRQFRLIGVERWNVPLIIGLLPVLLHISLLLFFIGLSLYVFTFDAIIAWVVVGTATSVYMLYFAANVLPMFDPQCPYKTPISQYGYAIARLVATWIYDCASGLDVHMEHGSGHHPRVSESLDSVESRSRPQLALSRPTPSQRRFVSTIFKPIALALARPSARTARSREIAAVADQEMFLMINSLDWVYATSSNPSAISVAVQAVSGLPSDIAISFPLDREAMLQETLSRLRDLASTPSDPDSYTTRERLARSLLFFARDSANAELKDQVNKVASTLDAALRHFGICSDTVQLQGVVIALNPSCLDLLKMCRDATLGGPGDRIPLVSFTEPLNSLRLNTVVWHRALEVLARHSDPLLHANGVHLALFIWRRVAADALRTDHYFIQTHRPRLPLLHRMPVATEGAIHALICERDCPHSLQASLKLLEHVVQGLDLTQLPSDRQAICAALHNEELKLLASLIWLNSEPASLRAVPDAFDVITRLAERSDLWNIGPRTELLRIYRDPGDIPHRFVRPWLQCLVRVLSTLDLQNEEGWRAARYVLPLLSDGVSRYPRQALDVLLSEDILAALWVPMKYIIDTAGDEPHWSYVWDSLLRILVSMTQHIAWVITQHDIEPSTAQDLLEHLLCPVESPPSVVPHLNHLAWCIAVVVFFWTIEVQDSNPQEELHATLLHLAGRTAWSHAKEWKDTLSAVTSLGETVLPNLGRALATDDGRKVLQDIEQALSLGASSANMRDRVDGSEISTGSAANVHGASTGDEEDMDDRDLDFSMTEQVDERQLRRRGGFWGYCEGPEGGVWMKMYADGEQSDG
ncbi:hypothetical protein HDZ31DRAFT_29045, partial [Schizophyllum fasciatum]